MKKNILLFMAAFVCETVGLAGATPIMIPSQNDNTWNMESQQYMARASDEFDLFLSSKEGFPSSSTANRLPGGTASRSSKDPASESAMMFFMGFILIWLARLWKKILGREFGNIQIVSNSSFGFPFFHIVSKKTVTDNCYAQGD